MGPLQLRRLAVGAWRDLTSDELAALRAAAFVDAATLRQRAARAASGGRGAARATGTGRSAPARRDGPRRAKA
jgi:hypothetical protein